MKSGVLFLVETEEELDSTQTTVSLPHEHKYDSLLEAIDVKQTISLNNSSKDAQKGKIAAERIFESSEARINDNGISESPIEQKEVVSTDFLYYPGEFFVLSSSSGMFAVELVNRMSNTSILRSKIDLNQFIISKIESDVELNPWKMGFYNKKGSADNGVIHGDTLLNDNELGSVLDSTKKNQLGLDYEYDGTFIRMLATESGYVEVYQPNKFDTCDFSEYVKKELLPAIVPE